MKVFQHSIDLPAQWDTLTESSFQTRAFLAYCEVHNPCGQRYYSLEHEGRMTAGAVVYSLRLDLFTFLNTRSPIAVNVVGVPCSVAASGVVGSEDECGVLLGLLARAERGFLLALNLDTPLKIPGLLPARTLPTVVLRNRFRSWEEYRAGLRSPYRRWVTRVEQAGAGLERTEHPCCQFSDTMYSQYLEVLARSKGRLETLTPDFFRHLPKPFTLTSYGLAGREVGWRICCQMVAPPKKTFTFFMGGVDSSMNQSVPIYFNILLDVLKNGIENGATTIDFGQTAEIPKLRLGGQVEERCMLITHSNPALRFLLRMLKSFLEYRAHAPGAHVFAGEPVRASGMEGG